MTRPKQIQGITRTVTLNLEYSRYKDLEQICQEEHISVSQAVRDMIEERLEKKAKGPENPITNYIDGALKSFDERKWTKDEAKSHIRKIPSYEQRLIQVHNAGMVWVQRIEILGKNSLNQIQLKLS